MGHKDDLVKYNISLNYNNNKHTIACYKNDILKFLEYKRLLSILGISKKYTDYKRKIGSDFFISKYENSKRYEYINLLAVPIIIKDFEDYFLEQEINRLIYDHNKKSYKIEKCFDGFNSLQIILADYVNIYNNIGSYDKIQCDILHDIENCTSSKEIKEKGLELKALREERRKCKNKMNYYTIIKNLCDARKINKKDIELLLKEYNNVKNVEIKKPYNKRASAIQSKEFDKIINKYNIKNS